ncbi:YciI family protein [Paenibacillus flagellatus]|uniref:YCII-related domain-containing protein n=1 Tax=Paenibacillus flagellatus TaxID=2211139 RepID=A0A2V5KNT4_9BACL|nr:YciI family protein [Paenibacillus flagellatus]PYI56970.1 hypothetical protein DLM86_00535 [Paenibacillus flagellatus]
MRFMMIVKATKDSEAGKPPSRQLLDAMSKYKEQLKRAGVLITAEDLRPTVDGFRLAQPVRGGKVQLTDGPFTDSKGLIAGFTLIDVRSREEAVEWALRMPDPHGLGEGEIEVREVKET